MRSETRGVLEFFIFSKDLVPRALTMPHYWTVSMAAMHCAKDLEETGRQSYKDDYIRFIVWKTASFADYKTVCLPHLLNKTK